MSEFAAPPPPQPPPLAPPRNESFDFAKPFRFVFDDPEWVSKVAIGGLFYLAAFLIIGIFFILGYCALLTRNVVRGDARPLPPWNDLGSMFTEGAKLLIVSVIYSVPVFILFGIAIAGGVIGSTLDPEGTIAGAAMSCFILLLFPVALAIYFVLPAALVFVMVSGDMNAAFRFGEVFGFVKRNFLNYMLAWIVYLVASSVGQLGIMVFCVGLVFTAFWAMIVTVYAFAEAYRLDPAKP